MSPSQNGGWAGRLWSLKRGIAATDELIEAAVKNAGSGLKRQVGAARGPAHRRTFVTGDRPKVGDSLRSGVEPAASWEMGEARCCGGSWWRFWRGWCQAGA
jgi:hypothetical protein